MEATPLRTDERTWAMLAHLSAYAGHFVPLGHIIAPMVIWLVKRESSPFIEDQAREALNAQISVTLYAMIAGVLCFVLIGVPLLFALWIADIVFVIMAALAANEGRRYRYPGILRLVK